MIQPAYTTGIVRMSAGSPIVRGEGTAWLLGLINGGLLTFGGRAIPIASVESNTQLTLAYPAPAAFEGIYAIDLGRAEAASSIVANRRLAELLTGLSALSPFGAELVAAPDGTAALTILGANGAFVRRFGVLPPGTDLSRLFDVGEYVGPSALTGAPNDVGAFPIIKIEGAGGVRRQTVTNYTTGLTMWRVGTVDAGYQAWQISATRGDLASYATPASVQAALTAHVPKVAGYVQPGWPHLSATFGAVANGGVATLLAQQSRAISVSNGAAVAPITGRYRIRTQWVGPVNGLVYMALSINGGDLGVNGFTSGQTATGSTEEIRQLNAGDIVRPYSRPASTGTTLGTDFNTFIMEFLG